MPVNARKYGTVVSTDKEEAMALEGTTYSSFQKSARMCKKENKNKIFVVSKLSRKLLSNERLTIAQL